MRSGKRSKGVRAWTEFTAVFAAAAALAGGAAGCQAVLGADFGEAEPIPECRLTRPPAPPAVADPGSELEPLVFVVSELDLGDIPNGDGASGIDRLGFDLDGSCTGPTVPPTCLPPEWSGGEPVDGDDGRDNGLLRLLRGNAVSDDVFRSAAVNARVAEGTSAPNAILRVSGYEGLDNDPVVEVELFGGIPAASVEPPLPPPLLDGADVLPVAQDSVEDPTATPLRSRFRATRAYVENFVLVAEFESASLSLANVVMNVQGVTLTARIVSEFPRRALQEGTVAGWVATGDMLAAIAETAYQLFAVPACTSSPTYQGSKELACSFADLEREELPSVGPRRCNALAFGYGFRGVEATIGSPIERPLAQGCPAGEDPHDDSCAER